MGRPSRVLGFIGALALIGLALGTLGAHSGSRGTLRTYLAELQSKGEKLTYAEIMRGRATNFFDSHAVITNAAARIKGGKITPGMLEPRRYVGPALAMVNWQQPLPLMTVAVGGTNRPTWEDLEAQMHAVQDALQEARDALKAPAPHGGPCTNLLWSQPVNFVAIRVVAQWLMGAAESDLHQGRLEAALQDLEALAGLANMERDEPTLVSQMIRVAVANLGLTITWEALQATGWTEPQLERLQKPWELVDLVEAVEKGLQGARASGYETFLLMRSSDSPRVGRMLRGAWPPSGPSPSPRLEDILTDYLYIPAYKLTSIDQDELFYLRTMQEGLTGLRALKAHHPWPETKQCLNQITANVIALARSPQRFRYYYTLQAIPNYWRACGIAIHAETERQMTVGAIALKRFQMRYGRLPTNLEALVPEFLPGVPYDYMGARPMSYRLNADGSYVLYSVGEDGKDDGGDPSGGPSGMWTGLDAVWPMPCPPHQSRPAVD
jgi:hypothetical protein